MLDISGLGLAGYQNLYWYISIFAKPGVSKDGEKGVKELRKKAHSAGVWHAVQYADPGDEELTDKPVDKEENEGRTFNFPMFSG